MHVDQRVAARNNLLTLKENENNLEPMGACDPSWHFMLTTISLCMQSFHCCLILLLS